MNNNKQTIKLGYHAPTPTEGITVDISVSSRSAPVSNHTRMRRQKACMAQIGDISRRESTSIREGDQEEGDEKRKSQVDTCVEETQSMKCNKMVINSFDHRPTRTIRRRRRRSRSRGLQEQEKSNKFGGRMLLEAKNFNNYVITTLLVMSLSILLMVGANSRRPTDAEMRTSGLSNEISPLETTPRFEPTRSPRAPEARTLGPSRGDSSTDPHRSSAAFEISPSSSEAGRHVSGPVVGEAESRLREAGALLAPTNTNNPDNKFQRVNELELFLDEMNHNELRNVAAGRPIDKELFQAKHLTGGGGGPARSSVAGMDHEQHRTSSSPELRTSNISKIPMASEPLAGLVEAAQSVAEQRASSYSDCALILQRTYVKSSIHNPKHHPLIEAVPLGQTEQACIGYKHIDKAIEQAKHKLKFRELNRKRKETLNLNKHSAHARQITNLGVPLQHLQEQGDPLHSSLEPPADLVAALGEINMATTQILADQFDLSNDELLNGLPLIDMSKTKFWPICPLLVKQDLRCELSRFRTMTGHCNNMKHPTWGAAMTPFARYLPPIHPDGIWTPRKSIISELTFHLSGGSPHDEAAAAGEHELASEMGLARREMAASPVAHPPEEELKSSGSVQFVRHAHTSSNLIEHHQQLGAASGGVRPGSSVSGENLVDAHYQHLRASAAAGNAAVTSASLESPAGQHVHHQHHQMATHEMIAYQPSINHVKRQHNHARSAPAELPPVRLISTVVHQDVDLPAHDFSILFMSWGQLLDHDMTRAAQPPSSIKCCGPDEPPTQAKHKLCLPIKVPEDDPFYSKFNVQCLEFRRSLAGLRPNCVLGPRVHQNAITSPIDANFVYGSSEAESQALRLFRGGRLRDRDWFKHQNLKPLLPAQEEEPDQDCLGRPKDLFCFLAGDVRVNEQIHLTVLHTLYMREHNRIADRLSELNPHWNDERIFHEARHIMAAGVQQVMINEYIPLLIGKKMASLYNLTGHSYHHDSIDHHHPLHPAPGGASYWHGYDPSVTTSVSNSFAAAAFRQGHTFIQSTVERYNKFHEFIGSEKLRHLFKQPFILYQPGALDQLTAGLINQPSQSYDPYVSKEVNGHLFQPPERQFGHDLASINLQRGREQGLPGYNLFREWCGLPRADTFDQLAPFLTNHTAFLYSRLYKHVDDIDLWSGGISERKLPGAAIGPTFACIIARQFSNTRRGDRFWFENPGFPSSFTAQQLIQIRKITLSKILCANSDDLPTIQRWALRMPHPVLNPRLDCAHLPELDLRFWQEE